MLKSFLDEKSDAIIFKLSVGLACVSVLIYSLFQLGYAFQTWALQFKDGMTIVTSAFSSTVLLSLFGLYLLFRRRSEKVSMDVDPRVPLLNFSFQEKGLVFARGLLDGLIYGR